MEIQNTDPIVSFWKNTVHECFRPKRDTLITEDDFVFHRDFAKLRVRDSILLREVKVDDNTHRQYAIPASVSPTVLEYLHNNKSKNFTGQRCSVMFPIGSTPVKDALGGRPAMIEQN